MKGSFGRGVVSSVCYKGKEWKNKGKVFFFGGEKLGKKYRQ
jgi:hypothetical protein